MCAMLDYNRVVTCSREPIIKLWDLAKSTPDGGPSAQFKGHEMSVSTVAVSPDKKKLASGGRDCTTRVWDVET